MRAAGVRVALALVVGAMACDPDQKPCLDLQSGDQLEIVILESNGDAACEASVGLVPGIGLRATVRDFVGVDNQDCLPAVADIQAGGDWTWTYREAGISNGDLTGWYDVEGPTCTTGVSIALFSAALSTLDISTLDDRCGSLCSGQLIVRVDGP